MSRLGKFFSGMFGGAAARSGPPTKPEGTSGVTSFSGFVDSGETHRSLVGDAKWRTFTNAINKSTIATGVRYRCDLLAGTEWSALPNEAGGKDAERGVEIVTEGLLKATMPQPWSAIVRKASLYKLLGFSLHEAIIRRRPDGMVVYASIEHRPQYTVKQWDIPDEQTPWQGIFQQSRAGNTYYVERSRLLYCVDNLLGEDPSGVGLLRHLAELVRRVDRVEELEIFGYETDLRGMPIVRAPIAAIKAESGFSAGPQQDAFVRAATADLRKVAQLQVKSPSSPQWAVIDSMPYVGSDKNTFAGQRQWDLELLKGDTNGLAEAAALIERLHLEMARILGIEFAMMGGSKSAGSNSMHGDKTDMFAAGLQATLTEIAAFATNDLARRLVILNGLDPDTATPTLVAEPISTDAIVTVTQALANMALAGLDARDPATNVLRNRMRLPPTPELLPEEAGVLPRGPTSAPGKPSPAKPGDENTRDGKGAPELAPEVAV